MNRLALSLVALGIAVAWLFTSIGNIVAYQRERSRVLRDRGAA